MRKTKDESLREFPNEADARKFLVSQLSTEFDFMEEVHALDRAESLKLRFDAVSICKSEGYLLGWEFKRSHLFKAEFSQALKQAADYRTALISDPRYPHLEGQRVAACILFPDWTGLHDNGDILYEKEANGMRLMASHFRVGTFSHFGLGKQHHIIVGEQAIWHSKTGWTGNAPGVLIGKRRHGSQKRFDK